MVYTRGLNNCQYYFAGFLIMITVKWASKPYSNYEGPYIRGVQGFLALARGPGLRIELKEPTRWQSTLLRIRWYAS